MTNKAEPSNWAVDIVQSLPQRSVDNVASIFYDRGIALALDAARAIGKKDGLVKAWQVIREYNRCRGDAAQKFELATDAIATLAREAK